MRFIVILAYATVSSCAILQSTLIWKEPKTLQLIRSGRHKDYMKKFKNAPTGAGAGVNVYRTDFEYGVKVAIGTPEQEALVYLTTESSIMWVPHVDCKSRWCTNVKKFAPSNSTTFTDLKKSWNSISFGGTAAGVLSSDRVNVGGIGETQVSIPNITFGLATTIERPFGKVETDGLFGLAFVPTAGTNSDPFITSAFNRGNLKPLFTLWLKPRMVRYGEVGGVITFGSTDTVNCGPVFKYESLSSPNSYHYMVGS
ncbi:hypothetical protein Aduo_012922 [Ancylostoma duodenale]